MCVWPGPLVDVIRNGTLVYSLATLEPVLGFMVSLNPKP